MVAPVRTLIQPKILSDVVAYEEELAYSRQIADTVKATTETALGTPVALDGDSKLVPLPSDGSLTCIGVAITARAATAADTTGDVTYIRRQSIIKDGGIIWPAGISAANKAKAIADLETPRGVLIRTDI